MTKETQYTTVEMTDGNIVDFPAKRKMQKTLTVDEDGFINVHLDFLNGEVRDFPIEPKNFTDYAKHGASQKFGDEIAGLKDVEDCVLAVDDLIGRLSRGEWTTKRASNGLAGASITLRAVAEYMNKPVEVVREWLKTKSMAEKLALRNSPEISPIVARLEAENAEAKGVTKIDTAGLLGELE